MNNVYNIYNKDIQQKEELKDNIDKINGSDENIIDIQKINNNNLNEEIKLEEYIYYGLEPTTYNNSITSTYHMYKNMNCFIFKLNKQYRNYYFNNKLNDQINDLFNCTQTNKYLLLYFKIFIKYLKLTDYFMNVTSYDINKIGYNINNSDIQIFNSYNKSPDEIKDFVQKLYNVYNNSNSNSLYVINNKIFMIFFNKELSKKEYIEYHNLISEMLDYDIILDKSYKEYSNEYKSLYIYENLKNISYSYNPYTVRYHRVCNNYGREIPVYVYNNDDLTIEYIMY